MLVITDQTQTTAISNLPLRQLIEQRINERNEYCSGDPDELGPIIVIEPIDTVSDARGNSATQGSVGTEREPPTAIHRALAVAARLPQARIARCSVGICRSGTPTFVRTAVQIWKATEHSSIATGGGNVQAASTMEGLPFRHSQSQNPETLCLPV